MHPHAIRYLVARMESSPLLAAVAGAPHVTNRNGVLCAMQVLESAAIIGLIRRTQSLTGRVGIVAGVLGMFRRERVIAVGGYDGRMATEDIDLTWRLLMAGWQTAYEPRALVGMQVPSSAARAVGAAQALGARSGRGPPRAPARALSLAQPPHVAAGHGVGHVADLGRLPAVLARAHRAERARSVSTSGSSASGSRWGIAISVVATIQLIVAVSLSYPYDHFDVRAMLLGPIYPLLFWLLSASAAIHQQITALVRGPRERRVVWDVPRERLDAASP